MVIIIFNAVVYNVARCSAGAPQLKYECRRFKVGNLLHKGLHSVLVCETETSFIVTLSQSEPNKGGT